MRHAKFWLGLAFVSATACGGSDEGGLFGGSGAGGGSAGDGAQANDGGSGRGSGGAGATTTGGSGGQATGGSGGQVTGGSGGVATGGAGGTPGGSGGDGGSPGGSGGDGGSPGGSGGDGGNPTGGAGGTGGTGGGGAAGWCAGECGSPNPQQPGNCYCDEQCISRNDCCPDYGPECHPTAGPGKITCGTGTCESASQFCCQLFSGGSLAPVCQPHNSSCFGPDIGCDGPEDCGSGQVCCSVPQTGGTNNVNFECRLAANCTDSTYRIVCGDDWTVCQPNQACVPHPWVPQYNYCANTN